MTNSQQGMITYGTYDKCKTYEDGGCFYFFSHFGIIHYWQHVSQIMFKLYADLNGMEHNGCGTNLLKKIMVPLGLNEVWVTFLFCENYCEKAMFEKQATNHPMLKWLTTLTQNMATEQTQVDY